MNKSMERYLIALIIIPLLLFSSVFSVYGEVPVIASRVSKINENIDIINSGDHYNPNKILFEMSLEAETLNRDDENQTVIELYIPEYVVQINASLVNQSLELEQLGLVLNEGASYTYPPGITKENGSILFYINQSGLSQLPDGNYTLWRPINTASSLGWVDPAEVLLTNITVISGAMNISYADFVIYTLSELSSEITISLVITFLISCAILVVNRRRTKTT